MNKIKIILMINNIYIYKDKDKDKDKDKQIK